jgi:hypothetical protein
VQINQGMELVSVPFEFGDAGQKGVEPKFGEWLVGIRESLIGQKPK